jgi:hypothetical protein
MVSVWNKGEPFKSGLAEDAAVRGRLRTAAGGGCCGAISTTLRRALRWPVVCAKPLSLPPWLTPSCCIFDLTMMRTQKQSVRALLKKFGYALDEVLDGPALAARYLPHLMPWRTSPFVFCLGGCMVVSFF